MAEPVRVLVLNAIAAVGLRRFPADRYVVGKDLENPDAILVRSQDMHAMDLPGGLKAVARAGAGTNNIPVAALSARGVPVFNAPGANANAVKELVLAGLLMAARNIPAALRFVEGLAVGADEIDRAVEDGKKAYAGFELAGHTLGIVGLGKIGCLVADAAVRLGMDVIGFDPDITVDAAWSLPSQVRKANSLPDLLKSAHFVTLHVPLVEATRHLIDAQKIALMKTGAVLLNFSRDGVVDEPAVLQGLASGKLRYYVCDFPSADQRHRDRIIALPHLGASTREAEDNCAIMAVDQLRAYLEHGEVRNSVNFPDVVMHRESAYRIAIANANVPNMVGQISTELARERLNIHNMLNKSRGDIAYTLVDVDSKVPDTVFDRIRSIEGVLAVRYLPLE